MKPLVSAFVLGLLAVSVSMQKIESPKVQVYSRNPGYFGNPNVIICHVTGFYPPEIQIEILKNGHAIPETKQTDLAFENNWQYHLTKHANFIPNPKDEFACRVTHVKTAKTYIWEPDM